MGDRFWPARRWLADRLVGDHAYSKNVAQVQVSNDYETFWNAVYAPDAPAIKTYQARNPQETA